MPTRGRAVVIGGGVAGLVWALDATEAGYAVTVCEQADRFGGAVRSEPLGPVVVDVGAESFALTRPDVLDLAQRLGLGDAVERPANHQAHVLSGGRLLPLPPGVLGIPADAADIARLLGSDVAARAQARDSAPVPVEPAVSLGRLVRERLGDEVADVLVDPVIAGVHATRADDAELASVAPSLHAAMLTHGGLMAGVRALRGALGPAGAPVATFDGGMGRLVERLCAELLARGATLRTGATVTALQHDGTWQVRSGDDALIADVLCLALPAGPATALLATAPFTAHAATAARTVAEQLTALPTTDAVVLVSLLLEDAALTRAGAPVGSGVLVADTASPDTASPDTASPGRSRDRPGVATDDVLRAKALTHASAKWAWLAERLPADHHVVRLSFGGTHALPATTEQALVAAAAREVSRLLGDAVDAGTGAHPTVRAACVTRWDAALSRPVIGRRSRLVTIDAAVEDLPRLALVGSAVAGNGLAGVVGRSRAEAARTL